MHLRPGLLDPVRSGQPEVKEPILDISGNLLGANQPDLKGRVVNGGPVGAGVCADAESGAPKKLQCRFLEAAGGQTDAEWLHSSKHRA